MHLIECYIAAGYRLKSGEEKNMLDHLLSPPNYGFKKEMITWVKEQIGCPSLKALCRMTIRGVIRNNLGDRSIYKALDDVPLPSYLLKFVKLEAFKNENIVMPTYAIPQQCVCCLERFAPCSQYSESEVLLCTCVYMLYIYNIKWLINRRLFKGQSQATKNWRLELCFQFIEIEQ